MTMRSAAKMSAIMNGLKSGREERRDIAEKRIQNQRETEDYEYKKKTHKLDLENKRRTGQISDMELKVETERLAPLFKAIEARDKLKRSQIDDAEKNNTEKRKFGENALGQIVREEALMRANEDVARMIPSLSKDKKTKLKDTDDYAVFEAANKMAKDDLYGKGTHSQKVEKYLPEARKLLGLGEVETKKSKSKTKSETIRMKDSNGKIWNIDADKVSNAEGRGATRL